MTLALAAVAALVVVGYVAGFTRCAREVRAGKAAARRRADAARVIEQAAHRWDAHTARLAAALEPLLADTGPASATAGFGDALVAEERIRTALLALDPPTPLEDPRP